MTAGKRLEAVRGAACLAVLLGCPAERLTVTRAQLGTPAARQAGSFHTEGGHRELTPPNIPEAVVEDEAVLARVAADETCIDLTLRSARDHEVGEFAPLLVLDGVRTAATIHSERATTIVVPEGGAPAACEQDVLSRPVAAYCVAVRTARLCAPRGAREIELRLVHPTLVYRSSVTSTRRPFGLAFSWSVR